MSGILQVIATQMGIVPILIGRNLAGTAVEAGSAVRMTFNSNGTLVTQEGSTSVSRSPEWSGSGPLLASGESDNWQVRATLLSGDLVISGEGSAAGTWHTITGFSGIPFLFSVVTGPTNRSGVCRFEIRRASSQVVYARADYNIATTCTDCG